jgi:hypothetical protein
MKPPRKLRFQNLVHLDTAQSCFPEPALFHAAENSAPARRETRLNALAAVAHPPSGYACPASPAHLALVIVGPAEYSLPFRIRPPPDAKGTLRRPLGPPRNRQTRAIPRRVPLPDMLIHQSWRARIAALQPPHSKCCRDSGTCRAPLAKGRRSGLRGSSPAFSLAGNASGRRSHVGRAKQGRREKIDLQAVDSVRTLSRTYLARSESLAEPRSLPTRILPHSTFEARNEDNDSYRIFKSPCAIQMCCGLLCVHT